MRSRILRWGAIALIGQQSLAWEFSTSRALEEALAENEFTLAAFVDPSLDSAKALESQWDVVRETEKEHVVAIDCTKEKKLCEEKQVLSYPAIRLYYDDGGFERYRGPRKAKEILPFLRRCLRPTVSELDSKNITSFVSIDDIVFVAHLTEEDENLSARYGTLAEKYQDRYSFGRTRLSKPPGGIGCYNNLDNEQHSISAAELEDPGAMERFVKLCSKPLVPELTRRNELEYLQPGKSLVYYFLTTDLQRDEYRTAIRPLTRRYQEYLNFVIVDANEYPEMLPMVGLEAGKTPALALQNPANGQVFPYQRGKEEVITDKVVEQFVLDIAGGKVKPWQGPNDGTEGGNTGTGHDEL